VKKIQTLPFRVVFINKRPVYDKSILSDFMEVWQRDLKQEETLLKRLLARRASRASANVKAHLTRRIQNCEARIAALKLAYA
jgi:hypothetical protein